jgi:predicted glycogen debranching enzyme
MSYIQFDKNQLINLEYSLDKEIIRSNRAGSYASMTIIGCNTRKYHGLLVCPLDQFGGEKHVLLSSLDETIIEKDKEFNLGVRKYEGDRYIPKGHKYVRDFEAETIARTTFRVGSVILVKESLLVEREQQVLMKYRLVESQEAIKIRFKPFLAFRSMPTPRSGMSIMELPHACTRDSRNCSCSFPKSPSTYMCRTGITTSSI